MGRDIQKILLHWGGWAAGEHCAGMGWARVSSGFRELAQSNSRQRVSCSDEDGRIIDRCVSVLGTAGLERERECIMDYYVKGMSKRAIGRKFKVREDVKSVNRFRSRRVLYTAVLKRWMFSWIWTWFIRHVRISGAH